MNGSLSTISPAWPTRWPQDSFRGAWTWVLAVVAALPFVAAFALGVAKPVTISYSSVTPLELYLSLGATAALEGVLVAVVLLVLPKLSKFSLRELGFRMPTWTTLGIAALGSVAMVVVANGLASLIDSLSRVKHEQDVVAMFRALHDVRALAAFAFFAVVVAPLAEEMLFRVFFFNLGLRYGGFWAGAVLSGVLFGMAHGDLYAAVPLALGGIILCYVYYRTQNAWASAITHGLFNSLSLLAILYGPSWISS